MDDPIIKPLTQADVVAFYGKNNVFHCRGWGIHYQGKLAAIVGVTFMPNLMLAWSDIMPDVKASPRLVYATAKLMMEKIKELNYPIVYAIADVRIDTAPAFLKRLGWTHIESSARGNIFSYEREE